MACKACGGSGSPQVEALPLSSTPTSCSSCSGCSQPKASCGCETFCEEDHTQKIIYKRYGFTLRVKESFVWPSLNETVTLIVDSVERLAPGALLWETTAGYLHVVSFDLAAQKVLAKNQGETCNTYTGGESLPECTEFTVGPPTCNTGSNPLPNIPYLAADFVAPEDGECQLASVTNITGLTPNDIVSINGYEYRIGEIIDNETITLCNDGDGAPVGTVIPWDEDGDGIPNIPIFVVASENPCTRDGIAAGVILACDGGDVSKPLTGSITGQIPVWQVPTNRFELKNISVPFISCTALTADLIVDPAHVGSYVILVADSSAFSTPGIARIAGLLYTINSVDSATMMHVTPLVTPGGVATYGPGTPVCVDADNPCGAPGASEGLILICDEGASVPFEGATTGQEAYWDDTAALWKLSTPAVIGQADSGVVGPVDLATSGATLTVNSGAISFVNPGPRTALVTWKAVVTWVYGCVITGADPNTQALFDMLRDINGGGYATIFPFIMRETIGPAIAVPAPIFFKQLVYNSFLSVPPATTSILNVRATIANDLATANITSVKGVLRVDHTKIFI